MWVWLYTVESIQIQDKNLPKADKFKYIQMNVGGYSLQQNMAASATQIMHINLMSKHVYS